MSGMTLSAANSIPSECFPGFDNSQAVVMCKVAGDKDYSLDGIAGGRQARDVATALRCSNKFESVESVSDLAGHERFIKAFKLAA